jgi:hypothetical protein
MIYPTLCPFSVRPQETGRLRRRRSRRQDRRDILELASGRGEIDGGK